MALQRWLSIGKIMPTAPASTHHHSRSGSAAKKPGPGMSDLTKSQLMGFAVNWSLCLLLLLLVVSQLLTILLTTVSTTQYYVYGQSPSLGVYAISGENDEPYSDRALVCYRRSKRFDAISVNDALMNPDTVLEDSSGTAVNGYRVVSRTGATVNGATKQVFSNTCAMINRTLDYIFSVCRELGYSNLTQDNLRIVDGLDSPRVHLIPNSLPVLIMPFWDNAPSARYAIPGWDGQACMLRLQGSYEASGAQDGYLLSVNRTIREAKTAEWLGRFGGQWRNGWYEDTQGMRWYSEIVSSSASEGIASRRFDTTKKRELNCLNPGDCPPHVLMAQWGSSLKITNTFARWNSVEISNGKRFGLFLYEAFGQEIVTCAYDFGDFISDSTFIYLMLRWILSMIAVQRGFLKGVTTWHNTDIGSLATSFI